MPVAITTEEQDVWTPARRKLWTREECEVISQTARIDLDRYELIDGDLIEKMPKNYPHSLAVMLLLDLLKEIFGQGKAVSEVSIYVAESDTPTNEPEPDVVVLDRSYRELGRNPGPEDIVLLIEVSDTTLTTDLKKKAFLYASAGIADYWVLDVPNRRFLVHRNPSGGAYKQITSYTEHEPVSPLASENAAIRVGDLLS